MRYLRPRPSIASAHDSGSLPRFIYVHYPALQLVFHSDRLHSSRQSPAIRQRYDVAQLAWPRGHLEDQTTIDPASLTFVQIVPFAGAAFFVNRIP